MRSPGCCCFLGSEGGGGCWGASSFPLIYTSDPVLTKSLSCCPVMMKTTLLGMFLMSQRDGAWPQTVTCACLCPVAPLKQVWRSSSSVCYVHVCPIINGSGSGSVVECVGLCSLLAFKHTLDDVMWNRVLLLLGLGGPRNPLSVTVNPI